MKHECILDIWTHIFCWNSEFLTCKKEGLEVLLLPHLDLLYQLPQAHAPMPPVLWVLADQVHRFPISLTFPSALWKPPHPTSRKLSPLPSSLTPVVFLPLGGTNSLWCSSHSTVAHRTRLALGSCFSPPPLHPASHMLFSCKHSLCESP